MVGSMGGHLFEGELRERDVHRRLYRIRSVAIFGTVLIW